MALFIFDLSWVLRFCREVKEFKISDLFNSLNKSAGATPKAFAIRLILSADGKRFIVSILPIKVGEQPTFSANSIWEILKFSRKFFIFLDKSIRTSIIFNEFPKKIYKMLLFNV